jgi:SAM-dependent methyltransferase
MKVNEEGETRMRKILGVLISTSGVVGALLFACGRNEAPSATPPSAIVEPAAVAPPAPAAPVEDAAAAGDSGATLAKTGDGKAKAGDASTVRTPDVIYVPTPQPIVDKMLELAKVKKKDVVYDLGCGDGRIVVTAAKKFGVKAFGFDIDPVRVAEAKENVIKNKVEHLVTIEEKDIFTLDLSPADVVTLYLLPRLNVKLIPQLEKLKKGARIVSHDFDMAGVKPLKHLTLKPAPDERDHEIYLWHTPLQHLSAAASP